MTRKYLPTLSELIDRLSINQLKEVFITNGKELYSKEISDIMSDIDSILIQESPNTELNAEIIRDIIILAQFNLHIWENESKARNGVDEGNNLLLTHSLNGVRNRAKNNLQNTIIEDGRLDLKVDCLSTKYTNWEPSNWGLNKNE